MACTSTYSITDVWLCDKDGVTTATTSRADPTQSPILPSGWATLYVAPQGSQSVYVVLCPVCYAPYQKSIVDFLTTHPTGS